MGTRTALNVPGMTCGHCVKHVTTELENIGGHNVSVDLRPEGTSTVYFDSETEFPHETLAAAIDEAGYEITGTAFVNYVREDDRLVKDGLGATDNELLEVLLKQFS